MPLFNIIIRYYTGLLPDTESKKSLIIKYLIKKGNKKVTSIYTYSMYF